MTGPGPHREVGSRHLGHHPAMSLSRDPNFLKLWSGYTVAVIGSQITILALPLTAVLLLGANATETGLLVAARMSPALVLVLFIGAWVDRLPRRPLMIVSDLGSALVIGSIPVAAGLGVLSMAQLYVVSFLAGVFALTVELARSALVPALVGRGQLVAANSRLQGSSAVAHVAGPSLGGILVQALSAPTAMLFDALSFLTSAALIASVRVRETIAPRESGSHVWHEIVEGLRWLRGHDILFRSIVAIALANIEWFAVQAILIVYATRELALPPALLGLAIAAIGPLSLLGAALAGPLTARWGLGPIMIAALFLETLSRLLLPFAAGTPIQAAAILAVSQALLGLTVPLWTVSSNSLQQAVTPERLLGRVNAATRFVALGVAPPAAFGAGVLADAIGFRATLFASGLIAAVAFVYLWASPVRQFRHPEPHMSAD
jgi:MFS family permease